MDLKGGEIILYSLRKSVAAFALMLLFKRKLPFEITKHDFKINPHEALDSSTILNKLIASNNKWFELDSTCLNSTMLPEVNAYVTKNSLLRYGTYGYFGSPTDNKQRYLFWRF